MTAPAPMLGRLARLVVGLDVGAVEESRTSEAIRRRVSVAAHDLVVVRRPRVAVRPVWRRPVASLVAVEK